MDQSHAWLVVNARSGSNSEAAREHLEDALSRHDYAVAETIEFPDRTLPTREELDRNRVRRLVVFTGDGTLNAIIEAATGWDGEILVLPGGTMNLLSTRLHGEDVDCDTILTRIARHAYRKVRPLMACCAAGRAHAGLLVGPGTAWAEVREAMRDRDLAEFAQNASDALAETTAGPRVRMVDPARGHADGYPLIELTPSHRGMQVDGYRLESAGEFLQQAGQRCAAGSAKDRTSAWACSTDWLSRAVTTSRSTSSSTASLQSSAIAPNSQWLNAPSIC